MSLNSNINDTISSLTSNFVSELIKNNILPKIVKHVNHRNQSEELTVEELEQMLALQTVKTHYTTKQVTNTTNKKCIWVFKRGKASGETCDKPTIQGSDYCTYCSKRPCFKTKENSSDLSNNISNDNLPKSGWHIPNIDVVVYNEEKGLYLDEITNYIFKKEHVEAVGDEPDKTTIYLIGKLDDSDPERINRLTNEEACKANFDGFNVDEEFDLSNL